MSLNIYNPTTQQLTEVAGLDVKDSLEKVATLPTPTADYLNQVYILVGTQEGYHVGSIYQCRYINSAYTWVEITGSVVGKADKAPNATNNHLAKLTADGNLADSGIAVGDLGTAINKNWTDLVRPNSHDLVESNAVYSAITNAISSIYTPHGDITCAELVPALLIDENIGNVYTVTDSGTTTAYFMQGAGKTINTSDSVSIIKAGETTILFNLMGNVLDLTDYQKKNLTTPLVIGGTTQTTVEGALGALSTNKATQAEVNDIVNVLGAKNLLPFNFGHIKEVNGGGTWNGNVYTYRDITYTVNADGTITVDGTASADSIFRVLDSASLKFSLNPAKTYYYTGSPASGGSASTYYSYYSELVGGAWTYYMSYGSSDTSVTPNASATQIVVDIFVKSGKTIDNQVFKPMLRLASDPDNTYVPYAMTNQQITPYVQAISNPNLLDNPWFTVNQRAQSSYTTNNTTIKTVDRWYINAPTERTMNVVDDGIKFPNGMESFFETIEPELVKKLKGKVVTLSVKFSGTPSSGEFFGIIADGHSWYVPSQCHFNSAINGIASITFEMPNFTNTNRYHVWMYIQSAITIHAVKLELGSVSTLAMDTAPSYTSELLKCQRYFVRFGEGSTFLGFVNNSTTMYGTITAPVKMRIDNPSVTKNGTILMNWTGHAGSSGEALDTFTSYGSKSNVFSFGATIASSSLTAGQCAEINVRTDAYIDFSADL